MSTVCLSLSLLAVLFTIYGAFANNDLWLASTQWLLIAGVLAIYALFFKEK